MILTTERLILKEFRASDLDDFASLMADPEVMRFPISGPHSKEQAQELFQNRILKHYKTHGFGLWAVIHKETGHFIGLTGLISQLIDGKEEVELGYRFYPKYWGHGFAIEAALNVCKWGFDTLNVPYIISIIDPKNHKSIKVAKKAGMHYWKDNANFHGLSVRIYKLEKIQNPPFQDS